MVHVIYTGENINWFWLIFLVPFIGVFVYFRFAIKPVLTGFRVDTSNGSSMVYGLEEVINLAENPESNHLYQEIRRKNEESQKTLLAGLDKDNNNPVLMYLLATTEFVLLNYSGAKKILDELITNSPDYKNAEAHLLYAKTLEKLGDHQGAIAEYESLDQYYRAPDATYYLALLLIEKGDSSKARKLLKKIIRYPSPRGRFINYSHEEFKRLAKKTLAELP